MSTYTLYLFLLAGGLSLLVHFLVIDVTHKKGIFLDKFDKIQKAHTDPIPRIGGLGIFLACMLIINDAAIGTSLMLASIPAFIAGFLEDYSGKVAPVQRLSIMLFAPLLAIIILPSIIIPQILDFQIPTILACLFTILFSIAMVNGLNFVDGQNGLAVGTIIISQLAILFLGISLNDMNLVYISGIISISSLAFLLFNYPNAKIFLGDGGAYFLGFITAIMVICLYTRHPHEVSFWLIPVLLIYPLWEVTFSTFRKLLFDKISPLQSDKYHLHQLIFRNQGHGKQFMPALIILPIQLGFTILAIAFFDHNWVLFALLVIYTLVYSILYIYSRNRDLVRRANLLRKNYIK